MDNQSHRVLILDFDPDTLIPLQHVFEEAGIDTAITWDETEACTLLGTKRFDLVILGDHPPEIDAAGFQPSRELPSGSHLARGRPRGRPGQFP